MGLSLDPNVTLPCRPRAEKESDVQEKANVEVAGIENAKSEVVTELENEAAQITRLERHIAPGEVQFLTNLLLKYGNDYKRMVRDKSNYYQHTYKQLKRKCEAFLLSKQGEQAMRQLEQQQM
ncbi:nucleolar protein 16-like [Corticium candelabrum]|uniref:nucleolar protein 16-like n=1 Tax=Corticium candelabrum TaxID=121492 RepID=UPI002E25EE2A|nr:nucleolar protein 16-like [Corticium candelabrum]